MLRQEIHCSYLRPFPFVRLATFASLFLATSFSLLAQTTQVAPTAHTIEPSRFEIYGGYGLFRPIDSGIAGRQYPTITNKNVTTSVTYFFSKHWGAQVEGEYFSNNLTHRTFQICDNDSNGIPHCQQDQDINTVEGGVVYRWPMGHWVPYVHLLAGEQTMNGPVVNPAKTGVGFTGGFGIDYVLPYTRGILAIRPIQADFQYATLHYGTLTADGLSGGTADISAVKLSGGLVIRMGTIAPKTQVALACTADPIAVFPGDPVLLQQTATNLRMKRAATYSWSTTGGAIAESDRNADHATLVTTGLMPGDYKVTGHVSQGSNAYQQASCIASFTVRAYDPPTISCMASPSETLAGTAVTITATASSPQGRPLTYSYSPMDNITGSGATVQLATAGMSPGTTQITCNVTDDLGHTASAQVPVLIDGPAAMPAKPVQQALCSISFERDSRRPARVDNEAKACLDSVALSLNRDTQATLVIVGEGTDADHPSTAAERAINAKQYLETEKGIEGSRIQLRSKQSDKREDEIILVPLGATLEAPDALEFDAQSIHQHGEAYGHHRQ